MKNFFHHLFHEKLKIFIRGLSVGGFAGYTFLFTDILTWNTLAWQAPLKIFLTMVLAFASGLATVMATDFWNGWLKKIIVTWWQLRKRKRNLKKRYHEQKRKQRA